MSKLSNTVMQPLVLLGEGYGSKVYLSANNIILRVPKNAITQARHERERQILDLISPSIKSLAIPRPSVLIEPCEEFPFGAVGYQKIDGQALIPEAITSGNRQGIAHQIAQFIHEIHSINPELVTKNVLLPRFPAPIEDTKNVWALVKPYLRQTLGARQLYAAEDWLENAYSILTHTNAQPTLLHGDLWYENMIFKDDTLVGVIDFESCMVGNPINDFMTQSYISTDFRDMVVTYYQELNPKFSYDEELAQKLMGIREIEGLEYGIKTHDIDKDQVDKIIRALGL